MYYIINDRWEGDWLIIMSSDHNAYRHRKRGRQYLTKIIRFCIPRACRVVGKGSKA